MKAASKPLKTHRLYTNIPERIQARTLIHNTFIHFCMVYTIHQCMNESSLVWRWIGEQIEIDRTYKLNCVVFSFIFIHSLADDSFSEIFTQNKFIDREQTVSLSSGLWIAWNAFMRTSLKNSIFWNQCKQLVMVVAPYPTPQTYMHAENWNGQIMTLLNVNMHKYKHCSRRQFIPIQFIGSAQGKRMRERGRQHRFFFSNKIIEY